MNAPDCERFSDLQKTILRTIGYFAAFRYPLTIFEIWKWQKEPEKPHTYREMMEALQDLAWAQGSIEQSGAFYGWVDEKTGPVGLQAEERRRRYVHAFRKERRLKKVLVWMSRLPFLEGVAVCNTLALHAAREESDIDLFVLTSPQRVWTVRFWMVLPLMLLHARPGEAKEDPVDTNFFVSLDALSLSPLALPEGDPYFLYWIATLSPVGDASQAFARLWKENPWVSKALPCARPVIRARHGRVDLASSVRWPGVLSEALARHIQEWKFPGDTRALLHQDTRVVANASVLKFHKNDRRADVKAAYLTRLNRV